jgi:hypothetical protein
MVPIEACFSRQSNARVARVAAQSGRDARLGRQRRVPAAQLSWRYRNRVRPNSRAFPYVRLLRDSALNVRCHLGPATAGEPYHRKLTHSSNEGNESSRDHNQDSRTPFISPALPNFASGEAKFGSAGLTNPSISVTPVLTNGVSRASEVRNSDNERF